MTNFDVGLHYPIRLDELPDSWIYGYVGDFCLEIQSGFACGTHSETDIGIPHLRPMNISREGKLDLSTLRYIPEDKDGKRLQTGNVLFNNTNSPELIGKTAYVESLVDGFAFSNHMTRLQFSKSINSRFAAFQLHFLWMSGYFLHHCVKHVNQASISSGELGRIVPFLVPPINEQNRILDKIEELSSELDKGIEYLKTAREQLKVHRQSVLKYAFEGKLTQQWREDHADQLETADQLLERIRQEREDLYQQQMNEWEETIKAWEENGKEGKKPRQPQQLKKIFTLSQQRLSILPQLPKGWSWVCSGNFFQFVTSGSRGWAKYYSEGGAIFLRITNLNFDSLEVDLSPDKIQYVQPPSNQEGTRTYVEEGDFLFSITGYLGMFAIAPSLQEAYVNQHIALARPLHSFNKKFVGYYITSRTGGFHHLNQLTKGAVKAGLTLNDVTSFPVPLCSIEEQGEIVNLIEMQLSHIYELDKNIEANLRQAEVLRQNILKKAFFGQLVPQDPNDEPASVLLERIRAERQSVPKPTRTSSTSRKKTRRKDMANLLSVLESANNWLSAQDVFQECGVSDGAETEVIEKLYLDLRDLVKENRIEVARRGDEDWLRILPTGRS